MTSTAITRSNARVCFLGPSEVVVQREEFSEEIGGHQLLVRCLYSLISPGTELSLFTGSHGAFEDPNNTWAKYPHCPGYAAVGEVEVVGSAIETFSPGDIVFYQGRHQRYAVVSPSTTPVLPVPTDLSLQVAPFARLAQISNTALLVSDTQANDTVAVIGLGLIGHLAAQLFRLRGALVIGVDLLEFRRALAQQAGITQTIDAEHQESVSAVVEATRDQGVRTVIEATGSPALILPALQMVRPRGEVILLGSPLTASSASAHLDVVNLHLIHRKGVSLKGAHESLVPKVPSDGEEPSQQTVTEQMLLLLREGQLVVDHLISDVIGPGDIAQGYASLLSERDKTMAVLIDWASD